MPNPRELTPSAVDKPEPESHEAVIAEDATEEGQEIRATRESLDPLLTDDPMPWVPYVGAAGIFYPKRKDRAILAFPVDGTPVIAVWWPNASEPDKTFS
jgi:hypothetical protein